MPTKIPVSPRVFACIQNVDIDKLASFSESELRPILPCLVRMSLCGPLDTSERWTRHRKRVLQCLSGVEVVNSLVTLLSIDFHALEQDARKEQQLRSKVVGPQTESMLISQLQQGVALEFERSDAPRKLRLLLSELLFVMSKMKEQHTEFYLKTSELFESEVYLEEVSDVLCIAQAELPSLLAVTEVAEALLHVQNGTWLMCRLVSNSPESFVEVCASLVANGERQDEEGLGGRRRSEALRVLCEMNPNHALAVRSLCVQHCRLPALAVALSLHHCKLSLSQSPPGGISDLVAFVSGLLLSNDGDVRNWFAQFIRTGQKRKKESNTSMLHALRLELLEQLIAVLPEGTTVMPQCQVVPASAFIRLYCSMKGIAAMRFTEEEIKLLLRLVTCRPPPTPSGVRFVSLGLCMLLACPYLLGNAEQERQAIDWIRWLLQEEAYFEQKSGVSASFGEMLLLIAIHFHSNQTHAIAELVCSTLGMKSAVKANALARMKTIFTQEIFPEQMVTAHAVKVPVTEGLSADVPGFLPVHCIYQLLRSRAFSKHKVPIKDWIFKQIQNCKTPIHSLLPPLIEVYINSIILPSTKSDYTNEPITEQEILLVFKKSALVQPDSQEQPMDTEDSSDSCQLHFTCQLLLLYYVLLYQDTVLSNMKTIAASNRKVENYSQSLLAKIPIKYLLRQAQREQQLYAGLFSPILRLLATHYPHLCVVEDWLDEELQGQSIPIIRLKNTPCTVQAVTKALSEAQTCSSTAVLQLQQLQCLPSSSLLLYVDAVVSGLPKMLEPGIPRRVLDLIQKVWLKLNTVIPRRLRVMTVNALRPRHNGTAHMTEYSEDDITVDPLLVLRCDERVFRCPPLLEMVIRVLEAFLHASRSYMSDHIASTPVTTDKSGQVNSSAEREELKAALVSAQESAAVQILLEHCLPRPDEQDDNQLTELREVRCLICSRLHQMFISDPNLAKLVHFQGYPSELLPVTVRGIPSMHICLDFIPELLSQPHLHKQMFAVQLVSYLSQQYALPKSLSIAKLAISVMSTLLTVLPSERRPEFFIATLPAVALICQAFPPLCDDVVSLLTQLGRVCSSQLASAGNMICSGALLSSSPDLPLPTEGQVLPKSQRSNSPELDTTLSQYTQLANTVQQTFKQIVKTAALVKSVT